MVFIPQVSANCTINGNFKQVFFPLISHQFVRTCFHISAHIYCPNISYLPQLLQKDTTYYILCYSERNLLKINFYYIIFLHTSCKFFLSNVSFFICARNIQMSSCSNFSVSLQCGFLLLPSRARTRSRSSKYSVSFYI